MKHLFYFSFILFFLCSCSGGWDFFGPDSGSGSGYLDYMPEKTQVGANTFGCYINGELAASKDRFQYEGVKSSEVRQYDYVNGYWGKYPRVFYGERVDTTMRFDISLKQAYVIMEFDSLHKGIYECVFVIQFREKSNFRGSIVTPISITKLDRSNHIISGEFDAIDVPLGRTDSVVHLTAGQFDIKYGANF